MMQCIVDAVIEDKGVNFYNIARHFKDWAMAFLWVLFGCRAY